MTERKPPGTSWETWIEAQIRVAREQGAFDNLPGAGKPLPNLGQEFDPDWWVKRLVQREQISILPPSLELLRKVDKELAAIEKLHDEATVRHRVARGRHRRCPVKTISTSRLPHREHTNRPRQSSTAVSGVRTNAPANQALDRPRRPSLL